MLLSNASLLIILIEKVYNKMYNLENDFHIKTYSQYIFIVANNWTSLI